MATTPLFPAPSRPITENQQRYLSDLLAKITSEPVRDALKADLNTLYTNRLLDTREASRQIDRVKAVIAAQAVVAAAPVQAPQAPVQAPRLPFPVVAPGRYAVEMAEGVRFYNVTRSATGRTEAKRYVSDNLTSIRIGEVVAALREIEKDPKAAALLFAERTERCYVCGRRLTDNTEGGSMAKGIGPDCEAKGLAF